MSRRNDGKYELVDGNASIASLGDDHAKRANIAQVGFAGRPPTLPTGEVIDGKNTLQSFDVHGPPSAVDEVSPAAAKTNPGVSHPKLPDPVDPAPEVDIVYAELAPTNPVAAFNVSGDHRGNHIVVATVPTTPWYKTRSACVLGIIIPLLLAVVVLGGTLGLRLFNDYDSGLPTSAPIVIRTIAPTTIRANALTSFINEITLSGKTITPNGSSPESQALYWLIYNDTELDTAAMIHENNLITRSAIGFRIQQRYSLLVMWFQQTKTTQWVLTAGWLDDKSECTWKGIACRPIYVDFDDDQFLGSPQNAVIQVTFNLSGSYVGVIPSDIGLLSNLEHFEIKNTVNALNAPTENGRYLQGTLPESIGRWTALTHFDVSKNYGLTGTLPDSIGQWRELTYFDASYNSLNGTLPNNIGQWTSLTYFTVSDNDLTGMLPESIGQWNALTYFDVGSNYGLNGPLPDSIGNWTALTNFVVRINDLNGPLPSSIGQWTALTHFDVYSNALTGTLPDIFGNWTALNYLDISYNYGFTGTLPNSIGSWTKLITFNVAGNSLNGSLPDIIGQWTSLTNFDIFSNAFTGTIPWSIGNWSKIEGASFTGNQLVGFMPTKICEYIDPYTHFLQVDCTVNCSCCTDDCWVE